jgi:hypothetical protein
MVSKHPGVNEVEWLADLKPLAEEIGEQVLGHEIRWSVETGVGHGSKDRSDVRVETTIGGLLFTGEAKKPDSPKGQHPLVTAEVDDAVQKAQLQGAPFWFTTNFFQSETIETSAMYNRRRRRTLKYSSGSSRRSCFTTSSLPLRCHEGLQQGTNQAPPSRLGGW